MDEQENTSEPLEIPSVEMEQKESTKKTAEASGSADSNAAVAVKSESTETKPNVNSDESADIATAAENSDKKSAEKAQLASSNESNSSSDEKPAPIPAATTPINASKSTAETATPATATSAETKLTESEDASTVPITSTSPKEEATLPTVPSIKKETNATPAETSSEVNAKDVPVYIKKEPNEDTAENSNSNSNEPHDLKMVADIKSEAKCGLDLTDHESKFEDGSKSAFDSHIKYGKYNSKYGSEPQKSIEMMKYGTDAQATLKFPQTSETSKFQPDGAGKFETKPFADQTNKYTESSIKPYADGALADNGSTTVKVYTSESNDAKYPVDSPAGKYPPPISDQMKYDGNDSALRRPPYSEAHPAIRSAYESQPPMKYTDAMQKYPGVPPPPISSANPIADLKYRAPENTPKSQFSAENLMKANIYADYPNSMKYPPAESPIDASARSTPNQDSQSSNSNLQSQPAHTSSLPSPHTNSPHQSQVQHLPPNSSAMTMIMGPSGMQPHLLSHLPPNHSSIIASSSPPSSTAPNISVSTTVSQMQPLSLLGPSAASIPPTASTPISHLGLHRPHTDIPPSLHGAFSAGILPPPTSSSQSQSRAEQERDQRRIEMLHHRSSPGLMIPPGSAIFSHASLPPMPAGLLPPHHPGLLPSSISGPASLPFGAPPPPIGAIPGEGRRTPTSTSLPPSSSTNTSSAFSRTSPSVQFSLPSTHRSASPSQPPAAMTRGSPLHLSHSSSSSALSAAAAAAAERDRQALMRQQSPHMTPPPSHQSHHQAHPTQAQRHALDESAPVSFLHFFLIQHSRMI